jgi:hypothetical protein
MWGKGPFLVLCYQPSQEHGSVREEDIYNARRIFKWLYVDESAYPCYIYIKIRGFVTVIFTFEWAAVPFVF